MEWSKGLVQWCTIYNKCNQRKLNREWRDETERFTGKMQKRIAQSLSSWKDFASSDRFIMAGGGGGGCSSEDDYNNDDEVKLHVSSCSTGSLWCLNKN